VKTLYRTRFWVEADGSPAETVDLLRAEAGQWIQNRRRLAQVPEVAERIRAGEGRWELYKDAELAVYGTDDGTALWCPFRFPASHALRHRPVRRGGNRDGLLQQAIDEIPAVA